MSGTRTGKEVGVLALICGGSERLVVSEVAQGGVSEKEEVEVVMAGAEIFLSADDPLHWFQYLRAMGLEAFSTDDGLGVGGGGFLETGLGGGRGASAKYPAV